MLFPKLFSRLSPLALLLLTVCCVSASAQVTGPTTPAPASSSDVQTAQIAEKPVDTDKRDVALSVIGQFTNTTNGNFVRIDPSSSAGGAISFRQSRHWWFGYELNYANTRYSDGYNKGAYRVNHDANEITAAYLVKAPAYRGLRGFIGFGAGAMIFSPSSYGGTLVTTGTLGTQALPLFVFSIGADHNIGQHFGVRFQYRDDIYKAPNFKQVELDAHKLRSSNEPALGVYYRF
jgi:hypothetical protein